MTLAITKNAFWEILFTSTIFLSGIPFLMANDNSSTAILYPWDESTLVGINPLIKANWSGTPTGVQVRVVDLTTNTVLKDWTGLGDPIKTFRLGEFLGYDLPYSRQIRVRVRPQTSQLTWPIADVVFTTADSSCAPYIWHTTGGTTYLRTRQDPIGELLLAPDDQCQPTVNGFRLSHSGMQPGDWIFLTSDLDYQYSVGQPAVGQHQVAVFSSTSKIFSREEPHRVPGAINAGVDYVTPVTHIGSLPTDIPEDFLVPRAGVLVQIPAGAKYIFVSQIDDYFSDNDSGHTTVYEINPQITYTAPASVSALAGGTVNYAITYLTDLPNSLKNTVSVSATGLPPGLSLGAYESDGGGNRIRRILGTPTQSGSYTVTVSINNGMQTLTKSVAFSIANATLAVDPLNRIAPPKGDSFQFLVQSNSSWSWSKNVSWITSVEPVSQSGNQTFSYSVSPNNSGTARTGVITVSGVGVSAVHTISQAATTFSQWMSLHGTHGETFEGDANGDGVTNGMAYAFQIPPGSALSPEALGLLPFSFVDGSYFFIGFWLPDPLPANILYHVQGSSDLTGGWESVATMRSEDGVWTEWDGSVVTQEEKAGGRTCILIRRGSSINSNNPQFLRLVVSSTE